MILLHHHKDSAKVNFQNVMQTHWVHAYQCPCLFVPTNYCNIYFMESQQKFYQKYSKLLPLSWALYSKLSRSWPYALANWLKALTSMSTWTAWLGASQSAVNFFEIKIDTRTVKTFIRHDMCWLVYAFRAFYMQTFEFLHVEPIWCNPGPCCSKQY